MTFEERNRQEKLLYEAFKGIKYRNYNYQQGLEAEFLNQFTDTAIYMIINQMLDNGVRVCEENCTQINFKIAYSTTDTNDKFMNIINNLKEGKLPPLNVGNTEGLYVHKNGWT